MLRDRERTLSEYTLFLDLEGLVKGEGENTALADALGIKHIAKQTIYDYIERFKELNENFPDDLKRRVDKLLKKGEGFEVHGDISRDGESRHLHIRGTRIKNFNGEESDENGKYAAIFEVSDETKMAETLREREAAKNYSDFLVYMLGHDVRNTISQTIKFIQHTLRNKEGNNVVIPYDILRIYTNSLERADVMFNNVIDLHKMSQKGKRNFVPHKTHITLVELINPLVDSWLYNFKTEIKVPEKLDVYTDKNSLVHIYQNIFENVFKYGDDHVIIGAENRKNKTLCYVRNNLRYSPTEQDLKNMNDIFYLSSRFEIHRKSQVDGKGIGLGVTKKLVEAHDGEIWAEYNGKDKMFAIYFTLAKQHVYDQEKEKTEK